MYWLDPILWHQNFPATHLFSGKTGTVFTCLQEHGPPLLDGLDLTQDNSYMDKYVSFGSLGCLGCVQRNEPKW